MGYMFDKELHVLDSDVAAGFVNGLGNKMVAELKKQEKVKENFCNTDGMLNVAMTLQDCFNGEGWKFGTVIEYAIDFVPRFKKYIEQQDKLDWGKTPKDNANKVTHMKAYRKILANIENIIDKD